MGVQAGKGNRSLAIIVAPAKAGAAECWGPGSPSDPAAPAFAGATMAHPIAIRLAFPPAAVVLIEVETSSTSHTGS
ncbi:hypothetical protein SAMN03159340_03270 [Sphingomonas sp. NFR15]|nr:hypothetical protein SAMN03159340_03270 [Sphingomonas sp. NFR15]